MFPTSNAINQTVGLQSAETVALTQGLIPNFVSQDSTNITYIAPSTAPTVATAPGNYQVVLSNRLAGQLGELFQLLFPITMDPNLQASNITNISILSSNQNLLLTSVSQIYETILIINQLTNRPTSRIPTGFQTPNVDPVATAGLNNNRVLTIAGLVWEDIDNENYVAAQLDYGTLRNLLRPYFNL